MKKKISLALGLGLALAVMTAILSPGPVFAAESSTTEAFTFVQLCDPQLGKGGTVQNPYALTVSSFRQAVRLINALEVDFVVICGDLIQRSYYDANSVADFIDITADLTVPYYLAPGNHDVGDGGNTPTIQSLNRYRQVFGEDYFSFEHKGYTFVIADTSLWMYQVQGESETHDSWFKQTLAAARDKNSPVFVAQHYPIGSLTNLSAADQLDLLALLEASGVVAVLSGHTHRLIIDDYNGIQLVTAESTGQNDDGRPLGFRLWHVDSPTSARHEFVALEPGLDFNGDGIINAADVVIMVDHWEQDYAPCDIAPPPYGDGIVDVQDLIVLAEHLFEEVLPPELIAYWTLDETEGNVTRESIGGSEDVVMGSPLWQPTDGKVDGALELDGVDDYIITDSVLNPADGPFSVLAWIRGGAPGQVIISQTGGANWLCADASEGRLMTELRYVGGRLTGAPLVSQTLITDGNWHRVGFVWDGSDRILYADDVEVARDTQVGLESSEGGLYIGTGKNMEAGTFWPGLIDDVRIYDRAVEP